VILRSASHLDMHDLGDMLVERGFGDPVMEVENLVVSYADPVRLLDDLKVQGSCLFAAPDRKGLGGKKKWLRQISVASNEAPSLGLDVKVEMVFGHAWKPVERLSPKGRRVIDIKS
jgi:malonyl-CoA O-methyltransferase